MSTPMRWVDVSSRPEDRGETSERPDKQLHECNRLAHEVARAGLEMQRVERAMPLMPTWRHHGDKITERIRVRADFDRALDAYERVRGEG